MMPPRSGRDRPGPGHSYLTDEHDCPSFDFGLSPLIENNLPTQAPI